MLWLLTSSVSLPQNRSVRCVLSASLHACLRTWTWHILSRCSSHSKPVLTIKWNMHAQLFSHSPSSGPLQTRLKKSFTRCARFSTVNGSQVRQFRNKLAYSHNLGWEIRSYRDIPWTTEWGLLAAEANYSAFYLFYIKYVQTQNNSASTGQGQDAASRGQVIKMPVCSIVVHKCLPRALSDCVPLPVMNMIYHICR